MKKDQERLYMQIMLFACTVADTDKHDPIFDIALSELRSAIKTLKESFKIKEICHESQSNQLDSHKKV